MKNIFLFTPDPKDATNFYRGAGPYTQVRLNCDVNIVKPNGADWEVMADADLVVMHRPYHAGHVEILNIAKSQGKKVLIDYDDDLLNLPQWHKTYWTLAQHNHTKHIPYLINNCDAITVSTQQIKNTLQPLVNDVSVQVIKNYIPFPYKEFKNEIAQHKVINRPFKILWRGGRAHHIDVATYKNQLLQFVEQNSGKIEFVLIGEPSALFTTPEFTRHAKATILPVMELTQYFTYLASHPADMAIVPLHESTFSYGISYNAWQECLHGGMLTVKPAHWFESKMPFTYDISKPDTFLTALNDLYDYCQFADDVYNQIEIERAIVNHEKNYAINARIDLVKDLLNIRTGILAPFYKSHR